MLEKLVAFHCNDSPWIDEDLKRLIKLRQRAFFLGNPSVFRFYRNKVNRLRKSCRGNY